MQDVQESISALAEIKRVMQRSERFISLSGWSGIAAGVVGLTGAYYAHKKIQHFQQMQIHQADACKSCLAQSLLSTAMAVLAIALFAAFTFTYVKAKKDGVPIWGHTARRLLWHTIMPIGVGGLVVIRLIQIEQYDWIVPMSLLFYGLGLINGSKFTLGTVAYLGYAELALGLIGVWIPEKGLLLWGIGFGILHIIYGIVMWWKFDRSSTVA
jgi:hypothetical protein